VAEMLALFLMVILILEYENDKKWLEQNGCENVIKSNSCAVCLERYRCIHPCYSRASLRSNLTFLSVWPSWGQFCLSYQSLHNMS
jgi:hypothetical protein